MHWIALPTGVELKLAPQGEEIGTKYEEIAPSNTVRG